MSTLQSNQAKKGECEVCDKVDVNITCHYGNMWFCDDCWAAESVASAQLSQEQKDTRVAAYASSPEAKVIDASRLIDNSVQVRTDLFNAATTAIVDLKKSIDENPEISNKPYALAEVLTERFNHFKQVAFDAQQQVIEAGNHQKAIQVYLNQLANSLRVEEREKLKIADINYKPATVKLSVKKVSTTQTKKATKLDKVELRKYAAELGISEFTLQTVVVSRGITVEAAANMLRRSINESKSESN